MAHKTLFHSVPERPDFPAEELKILDYWNKIDAFNQQLKLTQHHPRFTFYDGPPFATGLPHYGHMCAGTIKVTPPLKTLGCDLQILLAERKARGKTLRLGLPRPPRRVRNRQASPNQAPRRSPRGIPFLLSI